jgi:hypothetical protein
MRVAGIALNEPIPLKSQRMKNSAYPDIYVFSSRKAHTATEKLLGQSVDESSSYFEAVDGKAAEIVLYFRDPAYVALRRKLSLAYGKGHRKLLAGEDVCNDIEITTWRGKDSSAVLAVIRPDTQLGTAVLATLHFRSNSLYAKLNAERQIAYDKYYKKFDAPECNHQKW